MSRRVLLRYVLPAILGVVAGILALAYTVPNEPTLATPVVSLLSPGLKVAELTLPTRHESLAATFGTFLRIAIAVNSVFYFALFSGLGYCISRGKDSPR